MSSIRQLGWSRIARLISPELAIVASCLIVISLLWTAVMIQARFERVQTIDAAVKQNSSLAIAFEQYTIRTIDGADAVTQILKHEYARSGRRIDIERLIAEHVVNADLFTAVSIIDEHGDVVATSYGPQSGRRINIADREHFKVHVHRDTGKVFIGRPVLSRTFSRPSIAITRRINKPDGSFGGIVAIQMEPRHFIKFLGETTLHLDDVVSLVGRDGFTRARRTGPFETYGEDLRNSLWFKEQAKQPVGSYYAPSRLDRISRYFSFRRLKDYPLVTMVGVPEADVLERFQQRQTRYYISAGLVTALILTFGTVVLNVRVRRKRMLARLLESEKRLKALFDHSIDAIMLADNDAKYIDANPAACDLLGYTRAEMLQRNAWQMTPGGETPTALEGWKQFLITGSQSGEYLIVRQDGSLVEIEFNAVANIEPGVHLSIFRAITARKQAEEQVRLLGEQHLGQQRLLTHRFINTLEDERRELSFDLHDGLTQYVMSSFAFFEAYAAATALSKGQLPADLQKGLKYLQEAVVEARRMVNSLRSLALDELGLVGALEQLLQEEQERACWEEAPLLVEDAIPRFDTALETAAYRVVHEALTNIRKHSDSKRVAVRLRMPVPSDGVSWRLHVEVRDWGKGFDVAEKPDASDHVGLQSMEERVNLMNGNILIESRPGEGTRVYAEFPIEKKIDSHSAVNSTDKVDS